MLLAQSEFDALLGMIACILSGLFLKYVMMYSRQKWVETFHSTITFLTLPLITFVITKVISNNIALSLGMVGALSIVRFRNPVKNSLELVIYFALITIGISNSVNLKWGIVLTTVILLIIIFCHLFRNTILIGRNNLNLSFNEGEQLNTVEIKSSKKILDLEKSSILSYVFYEKDNDEYLYNLSSPNKKDIENIYLEFNNNEEIKSIRVEYV